MIELKRMERKALLVRGICDDACGIATDVDWTNDTWSGDFWSVASNCRAICSNEKKIARAGSLTITNEKLLDNV